MQEIVNDADAATASAAADSKKIKKNKKSKAPTPPPRTEASTGASAAAAAAAAAPVRSSKALPPPIPEPTYASVEAAPTTLPTAKVTPRPYASSMADLNVCGDAVTEMLRRTNSVRNPTFRPTHAPLPEHELAINSTRTRQNLDRLIMEDLQNLAASAAAAGLNEAWEDTQV